MFVFFSSVHVAPEKETLPIGQDIPSPDVSNLSVQCTYSKLKNKKTDGKEPRVKKAFIL